MVQTKIKTDHDDAQKIVVKLLCSKCGIPTNHAPLHNYKESGEEYFEEDGFYLSWYDDYQIVKCAGCESVSFRHASWFSEDYDYDDHEQSPREKLYPQRNKNDLAVRAFRSLPSIMQRIYRETVESYNRESFTLCAAGLRALVEGICAECKIVDGPVERNGVNSRSGSLEGKINGLAEKKILTNQTVSALHEHRFLGNEALHELKQPSVNELKLAIEILEHTFESVFEMPNKHTELKRNRGSRRGASQ